MKNGNLLSYGICIVLFTVIVMSVDCPAADPKGAMPDGISSAADYSQIFASAHGGWSLDEVLLQEELRQKVIDAFRKSGVEDSEVEIFESLIALRKSGKLNVKTTQSNRQDSADVLPIAEIAARRTLDQTKEPLDRVFIDPELLKQFDSFAREVKPNVDVYLVRKAAMLLRKSRRLKPELLARVTDWKVEITSLAVEQFKADLTKIPARPGIYIFRDETGYLYIGQSKDLRDRLTKHLKESDRIALAKYLGSDNLAQVFLELHVFGEGSPAENTVVREAYESELIRTRQPRLNLSP